MENSNCGNSINVHQTDAYLVYMQLSWHVQNIVAITLDRSKRNFHRIWIVIEKSFVIWTPGAPLTTMDFLISSWISNDKTCKMWDEIIYRHIPKLQRLHRWSLEMDK